MKKMITLLRNRLVAYAMLALCLSFQPGSASAEKLLDNLNADPTFAFSTRLLRTTYTGAAMQVRRSSDNAIAQLYFDTHDVVSLDSKVSNTAEGPAGTTSLGTWAQGADSVLVVNWYNQSPVGPRVAYQDSLQYQPVLALHGAIAQIDGKPALTFVRGTDWGTGFLFSDNFTLAGVTNFSLYATLQPTGLATDFSAGHFIFGTSRPTSATPGRLQITHMRTYITLQSSIAQAATQRLSFLDGTAQTVLCEVYPGQSGEFMGRTSTVFQAAAEIPNFYTTAANGTPPSEEIFLNGVERPHLFTFNEQVETGAIYYNRQFEGYCPEIIFYNTDLAREKKNIVLKDQYAAYNKIRLLSQLYPAGICSDTYFRYTPEINYPDGSWTWTRAAVTGISNEAVTTLQTGNISERLVNTTSGAIEVTYLFTLTPPIGDPVTQEVKVFVDPCNDRKLLNNVMNTTRAAYSTRLLNIMYTGPVFRIQRTDNTVVDLYFDEDGYISENSKISAPGGGEKTDATFGPWFDSQDVRVTIWYDQSGNGYHALAPTAAGKQPFLIESGIFKKTPTGYPTLYMSNGTIGGIGFDIPAACNLKDLMKMNLFIVLQPTDKNGANTSAVFNTVGPTGGTPGKLQFNAYPAGGIIGQLQLVSALNCPRLGIWTATYKEKMVASRLKIDETEDDGRNYGQISVLKSNGFLLGPQYYNLFYLNGDDTQPKTLFDATSIKMFYHTNAARCYDGYSPEVIFFATDIDEAEASMILNDQYDHFIKIAPVLGEATAIGDDTFTANWVDETLLGLTAEGYIFEYSTTETFETGTIITATVDGLDESFIVTDLLPGTDYWFRIKALNGDYSNVQHVKTTGVSGLNAPLKNTIQLWPNPAKDLLHIETSGGNASFKLLSLDGRIQKQGEIHENEPINISSVVPGIYLVKIQSNGNVQVQKIIVIK